MRIEHELISVCFQAHCLSFYRKNVFDTVIPEPPMFELSSLRKTSKQTLRRREKLSLIDAIVPPQELLKVSRQWALSIAEKRN
ncbi:putative isomerase, Enoyl-CoA hydratase, 3-hydroxyacyl-CoA dehydrogenase [Helianthus debilis subsp. tardiflorus]